MIPTLTFSTLRKYTDHLRTRQYEHLADEWVTVTGLDAREYGTHSMRRAKASLIYNATGNLRAVQILLGHSNIENIVRYLGVDIDDAITQAERTEIWTAQLAGAAGSRLLNYERMAALSGSVIVAVRPKCWQE